MNQTTSTRMSDAAVSPQRRVIHRTRGRQHGPIVRMVSPSDLGSLIKPFVFLDHFDIPGTSAPDFGFHPHSGIATLSMIFEGGFDYEDSTGATGTMAAGSVEWMRAGEGVWHKGTGIGERISGYQLWLALPPALEDSPPLSQYLDDHSFGRAGPARVILGELDGVRSPIEAPAPINYLHVRLQSGQAWRYQPPPGHDVAWLAVHRGALALPETVAPGELAVFAEGESAIDLRAFGDTEFVLASAAKHPYDLVLGNYSVHTSVAALEYGERGIRRGAQRLTSAKLL